MQSIPTHLLSLKLALAYAKAALSHISTLVLPGMSPGHLLHACKVSCRPMICCFAMPFLTTGRLQATSFGGFAMSPDGYIVETTKLYTS